MIRLLLLAPVFYCTIGFSQVPLHDLEETAGIWISEFRSLSDDDFENANKYLTIKDSNKGKQRVLKDLNKQLELYLKDSTKGHDPLFTSITNASLWFRQTQADDFQFLEKRLITSTRISQDRIKELRGKYQKWVRNPSVKNMHKYSLSLQDIGKSYEVLSTVHVTTQNGASIQYKPITESTTKTMGTGEAKKVVPIGNYHVWVISDGAVVSPLGNAWHVTPKNVEINLQDQ